MFAKLRPLVASAVAFVQAGVGAVPMTVEQALRERVSVRQFGAKGDGVTDDWAAIQKAADAAAGRILYFPATPNSYRITKEVMLSNNTTVAGDGRGTFVKLADPTLSGLYADGKTGVIIRDLVVYCDTPGTQAYVGGVHFRNATKCKVLNVEFIGMTWAGVFLNNSSYCLVHGCHFSGWLGAKQDSADVMVYQNSNFNTIADNHCYGGGDHGIMVYDNYANTTPTGNVIKGNHVGQHNAYGIVEYIALATTTAYNTATVIIGNEVRDILGSGIGGASGAGIYVQAGGGAIVSGNTVDNCCRQTTNFDTLAMAGIAVQVGEYPSGTEVQAIVTGNVVYAQRGPCLFASASNRAIVINGNVFKSTGTGNVRGEAVIIQNCNNAKLDGNTIRHENTNFYAVKVISDTTEHSYQSLTNNSITCVNSAGGMLVSTSNGGTMDNVSIVGNTVSGSLANPAYQVSGVNYLRFHGNQGASSGVVSQVNNCKFARMTGNSLTSSSAGSGVIFTGMNAESIFDETNYVSGIIQNDANNGTKVTQYGSVPGAGAGVWDRGDRIIPWKPGQNTATAWVCTTAGNPATWATEGPVGTGT